MLDTYLPYVDDDDINTELERWIDELVTQEIRKSKREEVHPEVPTGLTVTLNEYTPFDSIDLKRYDVDMDSESRMLAITDSYLHHSELAMRELISRTLVNQLVMNNERIAAEQQIISDADAEVTKKLDSLEKYRENVQKRFHEETADKYEQSVIKRMRR
ncbi:Snt309p RNJ42_01070 [Nakaseomyces bracarensis]|uniref:Snt309p n=1 Tax=Nakaseomyces bracarensis TaxID=273131 RepID=UPI00387283AF